ncbi:MAG: hypothetical protein HY042_03880 [Spirochaetia bacterium]|nr:hypothetical protein [Spirochaetia bacterium]
MAAYRQTELYGLLNQTYPPVAAIEEELRRTPPAALSELLLSEPECVFIVDYYFRLFPKEIAGSLISNPEFSVDAATELYNCQIIRHYRSLLGKEKSHDGYSSLMDSYWSHVGKERLLQILRQQITGKRSDYFSVIMLLQKMDASVLSLLRGEDEHRSHAMLDVFKAMGSSVKTVITSNLDLYDFIYRLALELKDEEYIAFLQDYTNLIVQLRIAENMVMDLQDAKDTTGKIPLKALIEMVPSIPTEALRIALEMMRERGLIDQTTVKSLIEFSPGIHAADAHHHTR